MMEFVNTMGRVESPEVEAERIQTFASSCFDEIYEQLFQRLEPLDQGVEQALGSASDTFPYPLPKVYNHCREICRRIVERQRAARQQEEEQQREEEEEQANIGPTEFILLLMRTLEDMTPDESCEPEIRNSLQTQLIEFLNQSTSVDPDYLVKEYERYLTQVVNAQMQRLRVKWKDDRKASLKDSGKVKRIVSKIVKIPSIIW